MQPPNHHLAQVNIGRLLAPLDDARVAPFMRALEGVNAIGKRSLGFVWMMEGAVGAGNTETKINGDAQFVSNLTVWESVQHLEQFVWNTVHKQFYNRRAEWFQVLDRPHFAMWWVPIGHRPSIDEALERLAFLDANGDTDHAFGWAYLTQTQAGKIHASKTMAAELG
jgi:hypothetical protein